MEYQLEQSITNVAGIGKRSADKLARLHIETVSDLLNHLPRRFLDYKKVETLAQIREGYVTVTAQVTAVTSRRSKRGLTITTAIIADETDSIRITWFNQPYRARQLRIGATYTFSGEFEFSAQTYQLMNPSVHKGSEALFTDTLKPIYPETKGLTSQMLAKYIDEVLPTSNQLNSTLPDWILKKYGLMNKAEAVRNVHQPKSLKDFQAAKFSLGFEELFVLILSNLLTKRGDKDLKAPHISVSNSALETLVRNLPYELTSAQVRVLKEVNEDLNKATPMNRLLEGDVGSGKTLIAAQALLQIALSGKQGILIAPSEVLARQHAETFSSLLNDFGINIELLTGSIKQSERKRTLGSIDDGTLKIIVGTHALLQDSVTYKELGLIVIDEQHRFGVEQRQNIQKRLGYMPHVLSMTATPIPRTLALVVYGELDVSILDEMPPGRKEVITRIYTNSRREQIYRRAAKILDRKEQVFVVCPLIETSEMHGAISVEEVHELIAKKYLSSYSVGLLHSALSNEEKETVMKKFSSGDLDVLVATTIVEVGIDIPNASLLVIEGAEYFGLAQLHQLRGRVGRSDKQAYCVLLTGKDPMANERLKRFTETNSGFELAEIDLELRGPGEIYGERQHGGLDLRIARLDDKKLFETATKAAQEFVQRDENLLQYPHLASKVRNAQKITTLN